MGRIRINEGDATHISNKFGIDRNIGEIGAPLIVRLSVSHGIETINSINVGAKVLKSSLHPILREQISHAIHFGLIGVKRESRISLTSVAVDILAIVGEGCTEGIYMDSFDSFDLSLWEDAKFIEACSQIGDRCVPRRGHAIRETIERIAQAITDHPEARGLIPLLVCYSIGRGEIDHRLFASLPEDILNPRQPTLWYVGSILFAFHYWLTGNL